MAVAVTATGGETFSDAHRAWSAAQDDVIGALDVWLAGLGVADRPVEIAGA